MPELCVYNTGEWDPNTSLLAHRMKELQGRRGYLKNFWYAAGESFFRAVLRSAILLTFVTPSDCVMPP